MANEEIFKYKIVFKVRFADGSFVYDQKVIEASNIMQAVNSAYVRLRKLDFHILSVTETDEAAEPKEALYFQIVGRGRRY